jgi:uncharacterized membrane protein
MFCISDTMVSISWLLHVAAMPLQTHAQWRGHEVNLTTAIACAATLPWTQVVFEEDEQ